MAEPWWVRLGFEFDPTAPANVPKPVDVPVGFAALLDVVADFIARFVVIGKHERDAITLWVAHTYVYDTANATPYLHPHSPEPGSGKSTLLDVLALIARNAIRADNLTEAVLFRIIDSLRPTLLFDEVDSVFGKKNNDRSEAIRQVLNSGYRKGHPAWRCVPPAHEVRAFDVFCPKATAGLNELPGTLAHRSIPIAMQPPKPDDVYEDLDVEEVEAEARNLQLSLQAWADMAEEDLRDPLLKPEKLDGLDARGNEIWRPLWRIADRAGGDWPQRARSAALELSGGVRRHSDASTGVKLLADIREVFDAPKMTCAALVDALNAIEEAPWGGWNDQAGIRTRELGKKLAPYGILAKTIRLDGSRANGYERTQFVDPWLRYLPASGDLNRGSVTNGMVETETAHLEPGLEETGHGSGSGVNPGGNTDVTVSGSDSPDPAGGGFGRPVIGDEMYPLWLAEQGNAGHITRAEFSQRYTLHKLVLEARA